ncbi:MAG: AlkZ-related protein [Lachnospiraceae bacterium]
MEHEDGSWIIKGLDWDNPYRIRTWRELISWINEVGFLPLFANEVPGFSAEEHVSPLYWFTGDPEQDPWTWREIIAATGEVAYGKFFNNKTGFISKEWFPYFVNARRDGYDFDAAWDDGLVQRRYKAIMDLFEDGRQHPGFEVKPAAGFGKDGYKNFEGCMTTLQMQTYLVIRRFERRKNKKGQAYGMAVSYYQKPEMLWSYDHVTSAYREDPEESAQRIFARAKELFPEGTDQAIRKMLK